MKKNNKQYYTMAKTLLVELICEEIPYRFQDKLSNQLHNNIGQELSNLGIDYDQPYSHLANCHRIAAMIQINTNKIEASNQIIGGPAKNNEVAVQAFLKKHNASLEQCTIIKKKIHGEMLDYIELHINIPAIEIIDLIPQIVLNSLDKLGKNISMMRWNGKEKFIRPVRNIICMLNQDNIDIKYFACTSNNAQPHDNIPPLTKLVHISDAKNYLSDLKNNQILLTDEDYIDCFNEQKQASENAKNILYTLKLIDWPYVFYNQIEKQFLQLPSEIISEVLMTHQKLAYDKNNEKYLIISSLNHKNVSMGYKKCINARLNDAVFFLNNDRKHDINYFTELTKKQLFLQNYDQEDQDNILKNKSLYAKYVRVQKLATKLFCDNEAISEAVIYMYLALTTNTVKEYPNLHRYMGLLLYQNFTQYCQKTDHIKNITQVLSDYHNQTTINNQISALLFLDKLDSLFYFITSNIKFTSSKDPYGVRSCIKTIIQYFRYGDLLCSLNHVIGSTTSVFKDTGLIITSKQKQSIFKLITDQLAAQFTDSYIFNQLCLNTNYIRTIFYKCTPSINSCSISNQIKKLTPQLEGNAGNLFKRIDNLEPSLKNLDLHIPYGSNKRGLRSNETRAEFLISNYYLDICGYSESECLKRTRDITLKQISLAVNIINFINNIKYYDERYDSTKPSHHYEELNDDINQLINLGQKFLDNNNIKQADTEKQEQLRIMLYLIKNALIELL